MRASIVCLLFIGMTGCANNSDITLTSDLFRPDTVAEDRLAKLELGMTMDEAIKILEPSRPAYLSLPALLYSAPDGGFYYVAFYDHQSKPSRLSMVLHYTRGHGDATYILPRDRKGKPFRPEPSSRP